MQVQCCSKRGERKGSNRRSPGMWRRCSPRSGTRWRGTVRRRSPRRRRPVSSAPRSSASTTSPRSPSFSASPFPYAAIAWAHSAPLPAPLSPAIDGRRGRTPETLHLRWPCPSNPIESDHRNWNSLCAIHASCGTQALGLTCVRGSLTYVRGSLTCVRGNLTSAS